MKKKTFTIKTDFCDKKLENVFIKQSTEQGSQKISLQKTLASAKGFVCVVAENAFSDELMKALVEVRNDKGIRIYALVSALEEPSFERLKNNCIIRSVPNINGNYIICDRTAAFFFDADLQGYAVQNIETVGKLHDTFIYEFWNNAEHEFVAKKNKVLEQTFDVSPVQGNNQLIINRSALSEKPYDSLLQKATDFVIDNQENISELIKSQSIQRIYLDKKSCEKNRDYLLTEKDFNGEIIYSDDCRIPLCKSDGKWYVSNSSFDKSSSNDGKLFLAEMETEPVFSNAYHLKHTYTYGEAVGKEILRLKDFSAVTISDDAEEEKSFTCDYKEFKRIAKMTDSERESEFNNRHLLTSNKPSAHVTFSIEMSVSKLSKDARLAPIYKSYEEFINQRNKERNIKEELIKECERNIKKCEDALKQTEEKYSMLEKELSTCKEKQKQQNDNEVKIAELKKKTSEENDSAKTQQYKEQLSKLETENKSLSKNIAKLQESTKKIEALKKDLEKNRGILESEQKKREDAKACLSEIDALEKEPETVADCEKTASHLENLKKFIPPFDKPCFGTLYKVKEVYEYELQSDECYDEAEKEMQGEYVKKAGVENIKFVIKG